MQKLCNRNSLTSEPKRQGRTGECLQRASGNDTAARPNLPCCLSASCAHLLLPDSQPLIGDFLGARSTSPTSQVLYRTCSFLCFQPVCSSCPALTEAAESEAPRNRLATGNGRMHTSSPQQKAGRGAAKIGRLMGPRRISAASDTQGPLHARSQTSLNPKP
jgi:hypothetical protein